MTDPSLSQGLRRARRRWLTIGMTAAGGWAIALGCVVIGIGAWIDLIWIASGAVRLTIDLAAIVASVS
ncbi:MAG: hypothetical protein AB7U73_18410 [Pirellulales bacterium]